MSLNIKIGKYYLIDMNVFGLESHRLAFTAQLVGASSFHLAGTVGGRHLFDITHELWKRLEHQILCDMAPGIGMVYRVFTVITVGGGTQL